VDDTMPELTTTPGGIWVLQALLRVETMPTALRLRPYIPSIDAGPAVATLVGERPLTSTAEYASLVSAGVIDERGEVDDTVRDWMAVVGRPEREVVVAIRRPAEDQNQSSTVQERTLSVCRRGRWLAMIARSGDEVVLAPVGETQVAGQQIELICDVVMHAFGEAEPAAVDGVNVPTKTLQEVLRTTHGQDRWAVATALARLGLSPDQVAVLVAGTRTDESAMAVVTVIDHGATRHVHPTVLTVIDSEHGRVSVTYTTGPDGSGWTSIWPTTQDALRQDLARLLAEPRTSG
jgi:hypothetical protein